MTAARSEAHELPSLKNETVKISCKNTRKTHPACDSRMWKYDGAVAYYSAWLQGCIVTDHLGVEATGASLNNTTPSQDITSSLNITGHQITIYSTITGHHRNYVTSSKMFKGSRPAAYFFSAKGRSHFQLTKAGECGRCDWSHICSCHLEWHSLLY